MRYNHAMVTHLFGPFGQKVGDSVTRLMGRLEHERTTGRTFHVYVFGDGKVIAKVQPVPNDINDAEFNWLNVFFVAEGMDDISAGGSVTVDFRFKVPLELLASKPLKYFIYRINFHTQDGTAICQPVNGMDPLSAGYFGITKRHPFSRFKEHQRSALKGEGHLLHKTWNAVLRREAHPMVTFHIYRHCKTLDDVYACEEQVVGNKTLAPKGLNAIPGGHAGIRMLHKLRLVNGTHQISVADRDAALVRLETQHHDRNSPCAHYRTGHFRTLPTGKMTWVSPCWINPPVSSG